jgi:hypothetical protein
MKVYNFNSMLESNGIVNPEDSELYYIVDCLKSIGIVIDPKGPWIAGGAILRTFLNQPLNTDIDLFFNSLCQYDEAYKKMKDNALFVVESKFSSTFKILIEHKGVEKEHKIQLVKFIFSEKAMDIINKFDINICEIAFDGNRVIIPEESIDGIQTKKMKIHVDRITHPAHTLKRTIKYVSRGFSIDEKNIQEFANKFISDDNGSNNQIFSDRY